MKTLWYTVFKITSGNHSDIQCHRELDLWPTCPKINKDHLLVMTNSLVKYQYVINNGFYENYDIQSQFELWPRDPIINRGHLLVMTNINMIYGFQDN